MIGSWAVSLVVGVWGVVLLALSFLDLLWWLRR